ncbi:SSPO protein, partial [Aegotheles bennettii]|nr:SSPO protein [Aegotheles bennettii]
QVRGLCGTYNGWQEDEFSTPAGDVEVGVAAFVTKFQVGSGCPRPVPLQPCPGAPELPGTTCAVLHSPAFQ